eukprot:gene7203-9831_t
MNWNINMNPIQPKRKNDDFSWVNKIYDDGDFALTLTDVNNTELQSVWIGDRLYYSAIEGHEFKIKIILHKNCDKYNGRGYQLNFSVKLDGESIGYSKSISYKSSYKFIGFDYILTNKGKQALLFSPPLFKNFYDVIDEKKNQILNECSDIGTVSCRAMLIKRTGSVTTKYGGIPSARSVGDTKKFFMKPNISIVAGRVVLKGPVKLENIEKLHTITNNLKIWIQTPLVIDLLLRRQTSLILTSSSQLSNNNNNIPSVIIDLTGEEYYDEDKKDNQNERKRKIKHLDLLS